MTSSLVQYDLDIIHAYSSLLGLDEVGRGCLAGPLVVAAVYLDELTILANLELLNQVNDSKKFSEAERDRLANELLKTNLDYCVRVMTAEQVDEMNPLGATMFAMLHTVIHMCSTMGVSPGIILVDGNQSWKSEILLQTVIKGDSTSCAIACASLIAKFTRDEMMRNYHPSYPQYGFDKHKGYGTPEHVEAILKYGSCPLHRKSFSVEGTKIRDLGRRKKMF